MSRRSNGVQAADYIRHIPRDFALPAGSKTRCGRVAADVNCIGWPEEANASDLCRVCAKQAGYLGGELV